MANKQSKAGQATAVMRLEQRPIARDALQAAEALYFRIASGETVGFALVEMHGLSAWTYDAVGACKAHPTLTRGHICGLGDELAKLARGEADKS